MWLPESLDIGSIPVSGTTKPTGFSSFKISNDVTGAKALSVSRVTAPATNRGKHCEEGKLVSPAPVKRCGLWDRPPPSQQRETIYLSSTYAKWRVAEHRRLLKAKYIAYKGGKCQSCGYFRSQSALEFHHRDPLEKDFQVSTGACRAWDTVKL